MSRQFAPASLCAALALAGCGSSLVHPSRSDVPIHGRVPAEASVLAFTRGFPGHRPSLSVTTGDLVKVGAIAAMIDRLRRVRGGVVVCPNIAVAPTVTLTFREGRGGPVVARASTLATGPRGECPGVTFRARGHAQRALAGEPSLLRQVQRVLGVKLTG